MPSTQPLAPTTMPTAGSAGATPVTAAAPATRPADAVSSLLENPPQDGKINMLVGRSLVISPALFVSQAAIAKGVGKKWGITRPLLPVKGTRKIGKKDMVHNSLCPKIEVDPETYEVRADGELLTCEPATVLPMAQRYFLF